MELVTGPISPDEIEDEMHAIGHILVEFHIDELQVTFGGSCDFNKISHSDKFCILTTALRDFLIEQEMLEIITIGRSELVFTSKDDSMAIDLCELSEIHLTTCNELLLDKFHPRWKLIYPKSYHLERERHRYRLLSGLEWIEFDSSTPN